MDPQTQSLFTQADTIYQEHFSPSVRFERAIFFSWGCTIGDCTFCYMSTQPADKPPRETKRSVESILAEFLLAKHLGWDIGFFTGGIGVLKPDELEAMLQAAVEIIGDGKGVHWPDIDEDISAEGMLYGIPAHKPKK